MIPVFRVPSTGLPCAQLKALDVGQRCFCCVMAKGMSKIADHVSCVVICNISCEIDALIRINSQVSLTSFILTSFLHRPGHCRDIVFNKKTRKGL